MKKQRKNLCLFLSFALTLSLSACHPTAEQESPTEDKEEKASGVVITEPKIPTETEPGYISTEIQTPDWIESLGGSFEPVGDLLYINGFTGDGGLTVAAYDTVQDEWQRYDLDTGAAAAPGAGRLSATEDSVWALLREGRTPEELNRQDYSRSLEYYLVYLDLNTGSQQCSHVDFWKEGDAYLMSFIALDSGRALVGNGEKTWLIDPDAKILEEPKLRIVGEGAHVRVNGELYVDSAEGLAHLDRATLEYENPINGLNDLPIYGSNQGHFLTVWNKKLCRVDPDSGERREMFSWMDVSLSYSQLFGWNGFENSQGDIFHLTDKLIKVSKGEVPVKQTLILACLGDASGDYLFNSYYGSDSLMDAILRFNHTDPEFKIEIRPYVYHDEAERNRMLIEITTGGEIDLLDTSLLPDSAVDESLFVDLLPYLDADESISREDFIPSLLECMMKKGGLYEYVDKYTMLTVITHPEFISGEDWTAEKIESLMRENPDMRIPTDKEELLTLFSWAATAEYIDRTSMSCHFDSPEFAAWLSLLKTLSLDKAEHPLRTYLFDIMVDFAWNAGYHSRAAMAGDYIPAGFPGAEETGSYFMKLGIGRDRILSNESGLKTMGSVTSLGIMASCQNIDGAWRFMRSFMRGEEAPLLVYGIPALKESFERAMETEMNRDRSSENLPFAPFNAEDAEALRQLVYNTTKVVNQEEALMDILKTAINAYLGGKGSAEETAGQIQSRVSLYLEEQG